MSGAYTTVAFNDFYYCSVYHWQPRVQKERGFFLRLVNDYFVSDDFNRGKQCIWLSTDRESVMCTAGKGVVKDKKK